MDFGVQLNIYTNQNCSPGNPATFCVIQCRSMRNWFWWNIGRWPPFNRRFKFREQKYKKVMVVRKYTYLIETNLKATLRKTLHDFSVMSWISCQRYSSFLQRVLRTSPGLDKARWLKFCSNQFGAKHSLLENFLGGPSAGFLHPVTWHWR